MAYASNAIAEMNRVGAQGCIFWDLEGQGSDEAYIGDPVQFYTLCPELTNILGPFVQRFTAAGFRIGFTLRPQVYSAKLDTMTNLANAQLTETLLATKINYAVNTFGASMFYVDTDVDLSGYITPATVFEGLLTSFPNVVIFPEWENVRHYAYTIPYNNTINGIFGPSPQALYTYPKAICLLKVNDNSMMTYRQEIEDAVVKRNNILLFDGWYRHYANDEVIKIYAKLG